MTLAIRSPFYVNGRPAFIEDYQSDSESALDGQTYDFDWAGLEERLGEAAEELSERDYEGLVEAFNVILDWLLDGSPMSERIGRRVIALAWVLNPSRFDGESVTKIASRLGLSKATLSCETAAASKRFGIRNRGQAHGWNLGLCKAAIISLRTLVQPHHHPTPPIEGATKRPS